MTTVICTGCGIEIAIDKAMEGQIEARVLAAERHKHEQELAKIKAEQDSAIKKEREEAEALARRTLAREKEMMHKQAEADLAFEKQKLAMEAASAQKKSAIEQESLIKTLRDDAESAKADSKALREQLTELTRELREERKAKENAEFEAQKKIAEEEAKIRQEVQKSADEKARLNLAAKEKTITDLQKALDEAQRKAAQGSQQLQGEIMELDLEEALAANFRDDEIAPVAKGVRGGDIMQTVKSPRGTGCGSIIWEIKRTKNWVDGWIPKLKEDARNARASIAIIVTEVMPKHITEDIGQHSGVWICKPQLAIVLGALLRKSLLDAGMQKAIAENRGDKAEALYNFVTSHEFIQQIESMVETYQEMTTQVTKERIAYEKLWAQREKQAQKLLMGTANIIGSMQGHVGQAAMLRIKGLELGDGVEELEQAALV
ncbi:DUF2130 domain-containing protein [Candidatus Saccharibacteria bacterium]|nr:DUF2130 domain-containing protein [Candidatus Saccharibacteria bacterium]